MILNDRQIRVRSEGPNGMIDPFVGEQVKVVQGRKVVSFGLSSTGYDLRLARDFKVFTNTFSVVVDPKDFDEKSFVSVEADVCMIPPNSFALGRTVERIRMPRDLTGVILSKSTYARCGLIVCGTVAEPGWEGYLTLEISNTTPLPARIYAGEGIAQILFLHGAECQVSYADRKGKYNQQPASVVLPRL